MWRRFFLETAPAACRKCGLVNRPDADWADAVTVCALALAPLLFLAVKSWTNSFLVVLLILALYDIGRRSADYPPLLADVRLRWTMVALLSGFLAVLFSQILRGQLETRAFDGPSRLIAAAVVMLHLTQRRIDFTKLFQFIGPAAAIVTVASLAVGDPFQHWGGRLSNYFVDPLTLGQYSLMFGALSLFSINIVEDDRVWAIAYKVAGVVAGFGTSLVAESRSAWAALPLIAVVWLTMVPRIRRPWQIAAGVIAVAAGCILVYQLVPSAHARVGEALSDLTLYFHGGNKDTSLGLRLSMWRATWQLFLQSPLSGYGDSHLPPLAAIPATASFATPTLQEFMGVSGAHSELLQSTIRSGIFGVISTVLIFAVPAVVFLRAAVSSDRRVRAAALYGLCYIAALFSFGLATEAINLKFLATFYGLMIAQSTAQIVWANPRVPG